MAIFCVHDGTQLPDDAAFCYKCGKPVTASSLSKAEQEKLSKNQIDALYDAILMNKLDAVQELLEQNPKLANAKKGYEFPLLKAVERDNKNLAKLLLQYGADPNEDIGYYVHYLNIVKSEAVASVIIEYGANVNHESNPLDKAIRANKYNIVKLFVDKGADVKRGTPVISAVGAGGANPVTDNDILRLLIAKGADINARDSDGHTPLFRAYLNGDVQKMEILLQKKANLHIPDNRGNTIASMLSFRLRSEKYNTTVQAMAGVLRRYGVSLPS